MIPVLTRNTFRLSIRNVSRVHEDETTPRPRDFAGDELDDDMGLQPGAQVRVRCSERYRR